MSLACQSISLSDISGFPCLVVKGLELNQCVAGSGLRERKLWYKTPSLPQERKKKKNGGS